MNENIIANKDQIIICKNKSVDLIIKRALTINDCQKLFDKIELYLQDTNILNILESVPNINEFEVRGDLSEIVKKLSNPF